MNKKNIIISITTAIIAIGLLYILNNALYYSTTHARIKYDFINLTSKIDGQIEELKIQKNSQVKKGEILLKLEQEQYKQELEEANEKLNKLQEKLKENITKTKFIHSQAENNIENAKIKLENANNDYVRYKNSYKDGTVTKKDLDNATKNLALAKENYENVQKNIELAKEALKTNKDINELQNQEVEELEKKVKELELKIANSTYLAPFDGIIKELNINSKQKDIKENDKIATIISTNYYIKAKFKKSKINKIKEHQKAIIMINSTKQIEGYVKKVDIQNKVAIIELNDKTLNPKNNKKVFVKIKVN